MVAVAVAVAAVLLVVAALVVVLDVKKSANHAQINKCTRRGQWYLGIH